MAKDYINNDNEIDCDKFINYINMLQEKSVYPNSNDGEIAFAMGELWAFPLMLKTAIIINLAKYTDELASIQKEIIKGKNTAEKVIDIVNKNPEDYISESNREFNGVNSKLSDMSKRDKNDNTEINNINEEYKIHDTNNINTIAIAY